MSEQEDEKVEQAVRRLLNASRDFTRAYEAWVESPRERELERRLALENAERRMTIAKQQVTFAQVHHEE